MTSSYLLPAADVTTTYEWEVKRSRFLTTIRRVQNQDEAREFIDEIKSLHPEATHNCSAYVFNVDDTNPVERSSDDGEPSGTAGKPMLEQLKGSGMLDIAAVVTRYFGGVKLGAGGLVHAYSNSVGDALPLVTQAIRSRKELYAVDLPHGDAGRIEAELRATGVDIVDIAYAAAATYTLGVDVGGAEELESQLAALTKGEAELREAGRAWVESA